MGRYMLISVLFATAVARKFSGTVNGDTWPFLAKFSYGVDKSGGVVGYYTLSYSYPSQTAPVAGLFLWDDDQWAAAYPGSCGNAIANANPGSVYPLPTDAASSPVGPYPVVEALRAHFWFFALASPPTCSEGVQLTYTLELTQSDGSQLGYDEIGLPQAYGCFFGAGLILLAAHVWAHYLQPQRFAPAIVRWYTASLSLVCLAWFCSMIDLSVVQASGVGVPFFAGLSGAARLTSLMSLWVVAALSANGVGVVTRGMNERNGNVYGYVLLGLILVAYIALGVYFAIDVDPKVVVSFGSTWPAIVLLCLTIAYTGWWIWRTRATILAEVNTVKRAMLYRLGCVIVGNFFILPFVLFLGAVVPAAERTRIVSGLDLALVFALYIALAFVLWPSRAEDAFRSFGDAASLAGMLGLDDGSGMHGMDAGFAGRLDEAYSYTLADTPADRRFKV